MLITNTILAILTGIALKIRFKTDTLMTLVVCLAVFVALSWVTEGFNSEHFGLRTLSEHFTVGETIKPRTVKYGDSILLLSWKNSFIRSRNDNWCDDNGIQFRSPNEIPRNWVWEHFIIEDAKDAAGPGNRGPVKFGDTVYLKTWKNDKWVSPQRTDRIYSSGRGTWERLVIESPDIAGSSGKAITYGDSFHLKTWRKTYISAPEQDTKGRNLRVDLKQIRTKDKTTVFRIYDSYGQGKEIDWARQGQASQSSNYDRKYPASNAIDGKHMTFNHTQSEQNAWWQVRLPKNVFIEQVHITNRVDGSQQRLRNFDVILLDDDGKEVTRKHFSNTRKEYEIAGLNRLARTVKVQLRYKNFLHLGAVKVYGKGVDYSILLENPNAANLISKPVKLSEKTRQVVYNDDIPYVGNSYSSSYSFFVKLTGDNSGDRTLMSKGDKTLTPHIFLKNGELTATVSTERNGQEVLHSGYKVPANSWTHIVLVVNGGVSERTGWQYGKFTSKPREGPNNGPYVLNHVLRRYYSVKSKANFSKATENTWETSIVNGMKYIGELSSSGSKPSMAIYVNGRRFKTEQLSGYPIYNNSILNVGPPKDSKLKGANFTVDKLRIYNYVVDKNTIQRESRLLRDNVTVESVRGTVDGGKITTIEPHMLPEFTNKSTVTFWLYCDRPNTGTKKTDQIFIKGNAVNERGPALWFRPNSNKLFSAVSNKGGNYWGDGIRETKTALNKDSWHHIAMVLDGKNQRIYINGKLDSQKTLPGDAIYTVSPVKIGGFAGKVKDFKMHNYALKAREVVDSMGRYPDYNTQQQINKIWRAVGCISNPFVNFSDHGDWVNLYKSGNKTKLEDNFKNYKKLADKGNKAMRELCYGDASSLFSKLQKNKQLLDHTLQKGSEKKCLPTAPFECKNKDINDFDIRTHKDFYKYTLTDRIIPPAKGNEGADIKDHPEVLRYKRELEQSKNTITQMTQLRNETANENKELAKKLQQAHDVSGPNVKNNPIYKELLNNYNQTQKDLAKQTESAQKLQASLDQASNLSTNPKYVKLTEDLQKARQLATVSLAQGLDLDKVRTNPLFKDILKELLTKSGNNITGLESHLQLQKAQLNSSRAETLRQLAQTQQSANAIYKGITGMNQTQMRAIADSKRNTGGLGDVADQVGDLSNNPVTASNPEAQKLAKQLNEINQSDVAQAKAHNQAITTAARAAERAARNTNRAAALAAEHTRCERLKEKYNHKYEDLKAQSAKCRVLISKARNQGLIEGFTSYQIDPEQTIKIVTENNSCPEIQALARNIITSRAQKDPKLVVIIRKAKSEGHSDRSDYHKFLHEIVKEEIRRDQTYREMLADMMARNPHLLRAIRRRKYARARPVYML